MYTEPFNSCQLLGVKYGNKKTITRQKQKGRYSCEVFMQTISFPGRDMQAKLTSRSAMTDIPTVHSVLPIKRTNHVDLRVCKNINQSDHEGQILTLRLHQIQVQSNQRFFFFATSRFLALSRGEK